LSPARVGNGAGRGRFGLVRGCPLGTGQDRCEWHASGTASEDDVRGSLAEWPSARPQGEARLRRACLVGKGRRPAAGVTWDSNPLRPCPNNRGSGHEGVVTCPFLVLVVTARARQGSPDDQGGTDPKRTRDRGSAPGGRPGSPGLPRCRAAVLSGRVVVALGADQRAISPASMAWSTCRLTTDTCCDVQGVCALSARRRCAEWPRRASGSPTVRPITGWLAGRGSVGAGCTTPGAIQLGGLSAPAVLGTEDPKRVERHAQSPPKYHPNRPECSTATERPDAN
jgi:hypothetical protein